MNRKQPISLLGHLLSVGAVVGVAYAAPRFAASAHQLWWTGSIPIAIAAAAVLCGIRLWVPLPMTFTVVLAFLWFALVFVAGLGMARDGVVLIGLFGSIGLQVLLWLTGRSPDSEPDPGTVEPLMRVGRRTIPDALAAAIRSGEFEKLADSPHIEEVFGMKPLGRPSFHSLRTLERVNLEWWWTDDWYVETLLGDLGFEMPPADSLLIGDLSGENPVGLDYRTDPPCVRRLDKHNHWILIAETVDEVLDRLRWER